MILLPFHPKAEREFLEACRRYETQREGLGRRFSEFVEATVERICENPRQFPLLEDDIRKSKVPRFPYGILFQAQAGGALRIVAVMHLKREPGYWRSRVL